MIGSSSIRTAGDSRRNFSARGLACAGLTASTLLLAASPALAAGRWSAPTKIDEKYPQVTSVSCPSASMCVALDIFGRVMTYDGTGWSQPRHIDARPSEHAIACASSSFCAVVGNFLGGGEDGEAVTYDGRTWSTATRVSSRALTSVSCASSRFCAAVGENGQALTYDGRTWTSSSQIDPHPAGDPSPLAPIITSASCTSASFCMAVDDAGQALTYNGTSWTAPTRIDRGNTGIDAELGFNAVSCSSSSFCVALGGGAHPSSGTYATTYDGVSWSTPSKIEAHGTLEALSCPTASFCVAVGAQPTIRPGGYALRYNGTKWSAPRRIERRSSLNSVSCASRRFCVAVGNAGDAFTYKNARPQRRKLRS